MTVDGGGPADDSDGRDLSPPRPFRVTTSDGLTLIGDDHGPADGPVVLFLHGYPEDRQLWDLVVPKLARELRCVTIDIRGAGASDTPTAPAGWRMEQLLSDMDLMIDQLGQSVHLVGHDWGSIQGWAYVLHPERRRRILSFTSMSGPPLHAVRPFIAREITSGVKGWIRLASQVSSSLYIAIFQLPVTT